MPLKSKRPSTRHMDWCTVSGLHDRAALQRALQLWNDNGWIPWQVVSDSDNGGYDYVLIVYRLKRPTDA